MAKVDVTLSVNKALLAEAEAAGLDLPLIFADALHRRLKGTDAAQDLRWAEDNALAVEALAGDRQNLGG